MKKVKLFLATMVFVIIENLCKTAKSMNVVNPIDDERNTTPMGALKDQFLKSKFISGLKIVRLANDRSGKKIFVLMSTWTPMVIATIDAPDDAEGRATCAEHIQTCSSKTLYITIPPILYGSVLTDLIDKMRKAKGKNQVIKAWGDLNKQLKKIMALVQAAMDADVTGSAAIICEYYGFHVKGKGGRAAQVFSGHEGIATGEIDLEFPIGPDGCCYDIKLYNATRTAFTRAQPTDNGHATVGGLVSGTMQAVSVTIIIHGVAQEESQIIEVRVK